MEDDSFDTKLLISAYLAIAEEPKFSDEEKLERLGRLFKKALETN